MSKLKFFLIPICYTSILLITFWVALYSGYQDSQISSGGSPLGVAIVITGFVAFSVGAYTLPAFIAELRRAPNYWIIVFINLVAGWTVLGWIAMLLWSITDAPSEATQPNEHRLDEGIR